MNNKCCVNCGKKIKTEITMPNMLKGQVKGIASFLCAVCLWAQVGSAELDFGKVAAEDRAANDFSQQSVGFIFSTTASTMALSASPGDLMIDFAHIYQTL